MMILTYMSESRPHPGAQQPYSWLEAPPHPQRMMAGDDISACPLFQEHSSSEQADQPWNQAMESSLAVVCCMRLPLYGPRHMLAFLQGVVRTCPATTRMVFLLQGWLSTLWTSRQSCRVGDGFEPNAPAIKSQDSSEKQWLKEME